MISADALRLKAAMIRKTVIMMIYHAKGGHTGGALSCVDILTVLYYAIMRIDSKNPKDPDRDRFILSKGHSVEPLYAILADKGFFPQDLLWSFSSYKSPLIGHPSVKVPGIELNSGALGHGLSCAVGMALAAKMDALDSHVYCLMGDGEQAEGSVWEAAMAAAHYNLHNLVGIIDRNHLQISGDTEMVMGLESLEKKYEAFGWDVLVIDGHSIDQLLKVLSDKDHQRPRMVIATTKKGKGVSYMEDVASWHHGVPDEERYIQALDELDATIANLGKKGAFSYGI